jgi:hypothetical protein
LHRRNVGNLERNLTGIISEKKEQGHNLRAGIILIAEETA